MIRNPFPAMGAFESLCEERLSRNPTLVAIHMERGLPSQGLESLGLECGQGAEPQPGCWRGGTDSTLIPVQGLKDLVWLPIEQYRKDGRIVRGFQRGAASFGTSTAMAALELTNRMVQTIQVSLPGLPESAWRGGAIAKWFCHFVFKMML